MISLDNANETTIKSLNSFIVENNDIKLSVYMNSFADISKCRNFLTSKSDSTYISFFDGDDFFTENYLYEAFTIAETHSEPGIYSPRYLLVFENDNYLVEKLDNETFKQIPKNMFEINYYIGQSFIHHKVLNKIQFEPTGDGYGTEDWHFSCQAIAQGYKFYNVPNTIFFYRRKKHGSLLNAHLGSDSVIRPSNLFYPKNFIKLQNQNSDGHLSDKVVLKKNKISVKYVAKRLQKKIENYELLNHYTVVQYSLHKNIMSVLKQRYGRSISQSVITKETTRIPERFTSIGFNEETMELWGKINKFEPMVRSSEDMLRNLPVVSYPIESAVSDMYLRFCLENIDSSISDIVLVPHLTKGGADLAAINLVKELSKNSKGEKVLVVTTINAESPWLGRLSEMDNVICIEAKNFLTDADDNKLQLFILRIIQHWGVVRLNIINAETGYRLATRYSRVIHDSGCSIYLHTFAFNMTSDGYLYNVISNGIVEAYDGVDLFITDSDAYRHQLHLVDGFDLDKTKVLYSPYETKIRQKTEYKKTSKVLWASRLCDDKLAYLLPEIAAVLEPHGISIDVYGVMDKNYSDYDRFKRLIKSHPNINYAGSYDGFSSIDVDIYDMYLITSKNEGLPFVVLEACASNIYLVAADVGGIPECIDGVNGLLVRDKFDANAYSKAILSAYTTNQFSDKIMINKSNKKVLSRHSPANYKKRVTEILDL
ncbi:MAG: glycosyltransferase [Candidatus Saccharimonadales bacterium]